MGIISVVPTGWFTFNFEKILYPYVIWEDLPLFEYSKNDSMQVVLTIVELS